MFIIVDCWDRDTTQLSRSPGLAQSDVDRGLSARVRSRWSQPTGGLVGLPRLIVSARWAAVVINFELRLYELAAIESVVLSHRCDKDVCRTS